jgi:hypothetical protein
MTSFLKRFNAWNRRAGRFFRNVQTSEKVEVTNLQTNLLGGRWKTGGVG